MKTTSGIEAWHWLPEDRRLRWGTRRQVEPGSVHRVRGPVVLCERGLHASRRAIDSLQYAPGPIVCRVVVGGSVVEGNDKLAGTRRTVLWMVDATRTLHEFAIWCAQRVLERERAAGREPHAASWAALNAKQRWLDGQATGSELAAAWTAAKTATGAGAGAAAWAAARAAMGAAMGAAAGAAAWAATTWAAERSAQNTELTKRLLALQPTEEDVA